MTNAAHLNDYFRTPTAVLMFPKELRNKVHNFNVHGMHHQTFCSHLWAKRARLFNLEIKNATNPKVNRALTFLHYHKCDKTITQYACAIFQLTALQCNIINSEIPIGVLSLLMHPHATLGILNSTILYLRTNFTTFNIDARNQNCLGILISSSPSPS